MPPLPGDLVWMKIRGFPRWPAQVCEMHMGGPVVQEQRKKDHLLLFSFGDNKFSWVMPAQVEPFDPSSAAPAKAQSKSLAAAMSDALKEYRAQAASRAKDAAADEEDTAPDSGRRPRRLSRTATTKDTQAQKKPQAAKKKPRPAESAEPQPAAQKKPQAAQKKPQAAQKKPQAAQKKPQAAEKRPPPEERPAPQPAAKRPRTAPMRRPLRVRPAIPSKKPRVSLLAASDDGASAVASDDDGVGVGSPSRRLGTPAHSRSASPARTEPVECAVDLGTPNQANESRQALADNAPEMEASGAAASAGGRAVGEADEGGGGDGAGAGGELGGGGGRLRSGGNGKQRAGASAARQSSEVVGAAGAGAGGGVSAAARHPAAPPPSGGAASLTGAPAWRAEAAVHAQHLAIVRQIAANLLKSVDAMLEHHARMFDCDAPAAGSAHT